MSHPIIDAIEILTETHKFSLELDQKISTVLMHKYLYYEVENKIILDSEYDALKEETLAYGVLLGADPDKMLCKGFDYNHPLALDAIKKAKHQIGA